MDENTVLNPTPDPVGDTGGMDSGVSFPTSDGTETGTSGDAYDPSAVAVGDTYVSVMSGDNVASRTVTLDPYVIQEGDTSLLALVNRVFGDYQPRTQTVTETMTDGTVITYSEPIGGLSGLDYYWLGGVLVFSIVLISFFKFLGGVFRGR